MPIQRRPLLLAALGSALAATTLATTASAFIFGSNLEGVVFTDDGVAIRGADPVAYFTEGRPVTGSAEFAHDWNGATWHFATAENRDLFAGDPAAYAPAYGGYCAWAIAAKGDLATTRPENWTIVDGRLFLNHNDAVQQSWTADIPGFIAEGDRRWPEVAAQAAG
jgi:YHS domain-containing protein